MVKNFMRRFDNDLQVIIHLLRTMDYIREQGGYGNIDLDMKDGVVLYIKETVRHHLK